MKNIITIILFMFVALSNAQENTVSEVIIIGNKRTKTAFLKKLAFVKSGSILDSSRIASDIRRLKLLPSVANVEFSLDKKEEGNYHLTYTIVENFAIIPGLNISTDNNGEFAFRTSVFDFNFLGRNQLIGGGITAEMCLILTVLFGKLLTYFYVSLGLV